MAGGLERSARGVIAVLGLVLVGAGLGLAASQARAGGLVLSRIGSFASPTYVTHAPGAPAFLYVVEQRGRVSVLRDGRRLAQPFLDIQGRVSCCGERGLLSIAFDPRFRRNRLFYAYYTNRQGNIEIDQFRASSNARAVPRSRRKVIVISHPGLYHNGGQLQFGPDGYLYAGTGDGASDGGDNARRLNVLLGKLLRIDPHKRGTRAYTVPPSNPFVGRPSARPEIYSYGLRNPWRFTFNSPAGALAIGDVGQSDQEEIDYIKIRKAKGANFGWPKYEGTAIYDPSRPDLNPNPPAPTFPIFTYTHATGCAVIGGYVVHDPKLPSLKGRYLYSDLCNGVIRSFLPSPGGASDNRSTGLHVATPTSFGEGGGRRVYVISQGGPVYRLKQTP